MSRKNRKFLTGFTLIELLVVIAIIGILASVVLASLNDARKKARDARRVADIKQLQLAFELYFDSEGNKYPASLADANLTKYIASVPKDPLSAAYTYEQCGTTNYHIGAALEKGPAGGVLDSDLDKTPTGCAGAWFLDTAVCSGVAGTNQGSYCYDAAP